MKPPPPGAPPKCLCSFLTSRGETHVSHEHPHILFTSCSSFLSYWPFQCQLGCLLGELHEFLSFSFHPQYGAEPLIKIWLAILYVAQNFSHLTEKPLALFWVPWGPCQSSGAKAAEPCDLSPEAEPRKEDHPQRLLLGRFQALWWTVLYSLFSAPPLGGKMSPTWLQSRGWEPCHVLV